MKKALVVLSLLLLTCVQGSVFACSRTVKAAYEEETITMRVLPANVTVKLGQPFSVNVTFENIPNTMPYNGVTGCEFDLTWNSSILRGVSIQDIAFHTAATNDSSNIWGIKSEVSNGSASYVYTWQDLQRAIDYGYTPFLGNGTWASITFVSVESGETDLHLSSIELGTISSEPIVGVGVDGKVFVAKILAGDIDQDGTVNSVDAGLLSAAFGSTPLDSNWNPNADINNDGVVDIFDAVILASNFGRTAP